MISKFFYFLRLVAKRARSSDNKIVCYHCGEKSSPSQTIYLNFDGAIRPVCCNGCATIIRTVESLGMRDEYLAHKIQTQTHHDE